MAERYSDRIKADCDAHGITIPSGFFRHPASRYVAIDLAIQPPRLMAKTWFAQDDLLYYLTHLARERSLKLLDFKERQELAFEDGRLSRREGQFSLPACRP